MTVCKLCPLVKVEVVPLTDVIISKAENSDALLQISSKVFIVPTLKGQVTFIIYYKSSLGRKFISNLMLSSKREQNS